jgi:hypothetical protein
VASSDGISEDAPKTGGGQARVSIPSGLAAGFCTSAQRLNYQSHRAFFDMVPFMGRWVQK